MILSLPDSPIRIFLEPGAKLPVYGTNGASAFDFHHHKIDEIRWEGEVEIVTYCTGVRMEIPTGWALALVPRSGHGVKERIRLANTVGVIDSDYRGLIKVTLEKNRSPFDKQLKDRFSAGDRICQGLLVPAPQVTFEIVDDVGELSSTKRGEGGHGSTGDKIPWPFPLP
jgi:dUTP pyrophosphatase